MLPSTGSVNETNRLASELLWPPDLVRLHKQVCGGQAHNRKELVQVAFISVLLKAPMQGAALTHFCEQVPPLNEC